MEIRQSKRIYIITAILLTQYVLIKCEADYNVQEKNEYGLRIKSLTNSVNHNIEIDTSETTQESNTIKLQSKNIDKKNLSTIKKVLHKVEVYCDGQLVHTYETYEPTTNIEPRISKALFSDTSMPNTQPSNTKKKLNYNLVTIDKPDIEIDDEKETTKIYYTTTPNKSTHNNTNELTDTTSLIGNIISYLNNPIKVIKSSSSIENTDGIKSIESARQIKLHSNNGDMNKILTQKKIDLSVKKDNNENSEIIKSSNRFTATPDTENSSDENSLLHKAVSSIRQSWQTKNTSSSTEKSEETESKKSPRQMNSILHKENSNYTNNKSITTDQIHEKVNKFDTTTDTNHHLNKSLEKKYSQKCIDLNVKMNNNENSEIIKSSNSITATSDVENSSDDNSLLHKAVSSIWKSWQTKNSSSSTEKSDETEYAKSPCPMSSILPNEYSNKIINKSTPTDQINSKENNIKTTTTSDHNIKEVKKTKSSHCTTKSSESSKSIEDSISLESVFSLSETSLNSIKTIKKSVKDDRTGSKESRSPMNSIQPDENSNNTFKKSITTDQNHIEVNNFNTASDTNHHLNKSLEKKYSHKCIDLNVKMDNNENSDITKSSNNLTATSDVENSSDDNSLLHKTVSSIWKSWRTKNTISSTEKSDETESAKSLSHRGSILKKEYTNKNINTSIPTDKINSKENNIKTTSTSDHNIKEVIKTKSSQRKIDKTLNKDNNETKSSHCTTKSSESSKSIEDGISLESVFSLSETSLNSIKTIKKSVKDDRTGSKESRSPMNSIQPDENSNNTFKKSITTDQNHIEVNNFNTASDTNHHLNKSLEKKYSQKCIDLNGKMNNNENSEITKLSNSLTATSDVENSSDDNSLLHKTVSSIWKSWRTKNTISSTEKSDETDSAKSTSHKGSILKKENTNKIINTSLPTDQINSKENNIKTTSTSDHNIKEVIKTKSSQRKIDKTLNKDNNETKSSHCTTKSSESSKSIEDSISLESVFSLSETSLNSIKTIKKSVKDDRTGSKESRSPMNSIQPDENSNNTFKKSITTDQNHIEVNNFNTASDTNHHLNKSLEKKYSQKCIDLNGKMNNNENSEITKLSNSLTATSDVENSSDDNSLLHKTVSSIWKSWRTKNTISSTEKSDETDSAKSPSHKGSILKKENTNKIINTSLPTDQINSKENNIKTTSTSDHNIKEVIKTKSSQRKIDKTLNKDNNETKSSHCTTKSSESSKSIEDSISLESLFSLSETSLNSIKTIKKSVKYDRTGSKESRSPMNSIQPDENSNNTFKKSITTDQNHIEVNNFNTASDTNHHLNKSLEKKYSQKCIDLNGKMNNNENSEITKLSNSLTATSDVENSSDDNSLLHKTVSSIWKSWRTKNTISSTEKSDETDSAKSPSHKGSILKKENTNKIINTSLPTDQINSKENNIKTTSTSDHNIKEVIKTKSSQRKIDKTLNKDNNETKSSHCTTKSSESSKSIEDSISLESVFSLSETSLNSIKTIKKSVKDDRTGSKESRSPMNSIQPDENSNNTFKKSITTDQNHIEVNNFNTASDTNHHLNKSLEKKYSQKCIDLNGKMNNNENSEITKLSNSLTATSDVENSSDDNSLLHKTVSSIWKSWRTKNTISSTEKSDETDSAKSPSHKGSTLKKENTNKIINTSLPTDQINSKENNIKTTSTSDHNIKEVIKTKSSQRKIAKTLNKDNNETKSSHCTTKSSESSKSIEDSISLESVFSLSETSLNSIKTIKKSVKDDRTGSKESRSPMNSIQPDENSNNTFKKSITTDQNHIEVNNFNTASDTNHHLNKSLEKKYSQKCIDLNGKMNNNENSEITKLSNSLTATSDVENSSDDNSLLHKTVSSIWKSWRTKNTISSTEKSDETDSAKSPSHKGSILKKENTNKNINTSIPTDQINSKENNIKTTSTSDHNIKEVITKKSSHRGIDKPLNNENNENKDKTKSSHCITKTSESSKSLEDNNSLESEFSVSETSLNSLKTIKKTVYDDRTGSKESRSPIDSNQPDENSNYTVKKSLTTDQNHMEVNNFNTASDTDHPLNKSLEKKNTQNYIDLTVNMDKTDKTDMKKPSQSVTEITVTDDSANGNSSLGTVVPSIWPARHTTKTMSKTDKTDETESEKSPSPMSSILPNEYKNKIINTSMATDMINSKENNFKTTSTSDQNIKEVIKTESSQRGIDKPLNNENNENKDTTNLYHCITKISESSKSLEDNNSLESVFSLSETSLNSLKTIKKTVYDDRTGSKESRSPIDSNQPDENSNYTVKKSLTTDQNHMEVNNFNTASETDHPLNKSLEKKNSQKCIDLTVNMDKTDKTDLKKPSQSVTEITVKDDSANGNSSLGTVVPSIWPERHTTKTMSKTDKTDETESEKSPSPMSSILPNEYSNKIINTSIPTDQINSKEKNIKTTSTSDHNIKEVIKTESSKRGIDKPLNNENNENKDKTNLSHCITKTSESSKSLEDNISLESVFSLSETSLNSITTIKNSVKDDRTGSKESRSPIDSNQPDENSNYTVKKSLTTDQNHMEVNNFNTASETDHPLNKSLEKKNSQKCIDLTVNMDKTDKTDLKKPSQSVTEITVKDDSANGNSSLGTVVPSIWPARHTTKTLSKTDKTDETESEKSPSPMSSILPNEYSNKIINTSIPTDQINSKENNIKTTSTSDHNIKEVIKTESSQRGIDKPLNNENNENKDKTNLSHCITKISESSKSLEDNNSLESVFSLSETSLNSLKTIKNSVYDDRTGSKESRSPMDSNQRDENSNYTVKKSITTDQSHIEVNNFNTVSDTDHPLNKSLEKKNTQNYIDLTVNMDKTDKTDLKKPSQSVTEITVKDDSANGNSSLGTVVPSIWPERHTTKTMSKTDKTDETESEKSPSPMSSILPNEYSNKIINTSIPTDQINSKENNIKTTSTSDHNIKEVIKTESSQRGIDKPLNNENNENKDKTNLSHCITKISESSKSLEDNNSLESVFSLSETSLNSIKTIKKSVKDDRTGSKESRSPMDSNQRDENSNYTVKKSITTDQSHIEVNNFNTASDTDHPLNKSLEKKNTQNYIDLTVNMDKTDKTDMKKSSQSVTEKAVTDDSSNGNSSLGTVVPSIWPARHTTKTISKTDKTDDTESAKSSSPMSSILPNEYSNKIINTSIPTDQINSKENNIKSTSTSDHNIKEVIKTESSHRGIDKPLNNENNEKKDKTKSFHCITKTSESSKSLEDNISLESVFSLSETSLNSITTIKNSVNDDRTGSKESRSPIDSNQPDENSNYTVKKSLTTDQNHMEVNNFNTASETDHPLNKSLEKKNSQKCIDLTVNMDKTDKTDLKKPSQSVTEITVKDDSANGNSSLGTVVPSIWPERHTTKTMSKTDKTDETESEKSPSPMSSILPNEYSNKIINTSIPTDQINSKENNIKTTSTSDHNIKEVIKTESSQRGIDKPLNNENNENKDKTNLSHCITKISESSKSLEDNNSLESVFSLSETSLNSLKTIKNSVKDDRTGSKESRSPIDSNQPDENSNYTVKKSLTTDQNHMEVNNFNTASETDHPLNKSLEKKNSQKCIDLTVNMDKTDKTDLKKPSQSVTEITVKDDSANGNSSLGTVVPSIWPERHTTKTMSKTDKTDETESEKSPSPMSSILPNEYSNKIINTSIPTDQINSKENNIKTTSTSDHNIKEVIKTESSQRGIDKPLNNENNENKDKTNLSHCITKISESSKSLEDNNSLESVFSLSETSLNSLKTIKNSVKDDRTGSKESRSPIDSNQPDENSNYTVKKSLTTDQNHMEVNNFNTASETDHPLNKSLEKKNSQKCIDLTVNMDKTDKTDLKKPSQSVTEITVKDDSANGNSSLGTVVPSKWPERHTTKTMSKTDKTDETESEKSPSPMSSILPNEYSNKIINTSIPTDQINSKENNIKTTSTSDHNIKEVIKTDSSQRGIDKPLNNENNENKDKTNLSHCITKTSESSKSLEDNISLESVFSLSETSLNSITTIKNSVKDDRTGSKESRSPIDSNQPDENSNYTVKKSLTTDQNHMEVNNFNTASETDHPLNKSLEKKNSQKCIDLTVNMDKTDKTDLKIPSQSVTEITVKDDSANSNSSLGTVVPSIWPERHTTKTMSKTDKTDETESEKSPSPMSSILPNEYSNKIINTSIPTDQINSKENNIKTTSTSDHNIKEVIKTESSKRGIDKPLNNENNENKDKTNLSHYITKTSESSKSLEDNISLESVFSLSETSLNSITTIKNSVKDDRTGSKESRSPIDSNQPDENSNYTVKKSLTTDQNHMEVNNFNTASETDHPLNKSLEKKNSQKCIDLTVNMDKTDKTDLKKPSQSVTEITVKDDSANGNSSLGTVVPSIWPERHTTKTMSKTDKTDETDSEKSPSPMSSILPNEYSNKIINTSIPTDQINSKENNIKTTSTSDHNIKEVIKTESSQRGIDKPLNNENNENKDKTNLSHCITKISESSKSLEDNNSLESVFSLSETSLNSLKTIKNSVKDDRTGSKESRSPIDSNQPDENSNYTVKKSLTTDQNHMEVNNFNTASETDHPLNKSLEKKNSQKCIDLTVNMDKTDKTDLKKPSQSVTEITVKDDSANGNSSLGTVVPSIWPERHTTKTMSKTDKTDETESEKSPSPMSSILPNEYSNKIINTSIPTDQINSKENNIKTTSTSDHNIKEVIKTESSQRGIDKPLNNENNENKDKTNLSHCITKISESSKSLEDNNSLESVFSLSETSLNSLKTIKNSVKDDRTGSKESRSPIDSNQPDENSNYTVKKSLTTDQNHMEVNNFNTASETDHPLNKSLEKKNSQKCIDLTVNMDKTDKTDLKKPSQSVTEITVKDDSANGNSSLGTVVPSKWPERHTTKTMSKTDKTDETESEKSPSPMSSILPNEYSNKIINTSIPTDQINSKENNIKTTSTSDHNIKEVIKTDSSQRGIDKPLNNENNENKDKTNLSHCITKTSESSKSLEDNISLESVFSLSETSLNSITTIKNSVKDDRTGSKESRSPIDSNQPDENSNYTVKKSLTTDQNHMEVNNFNTASETDHPLNKSLEKKNSQKCIDLTVNMDKTDKTDLKIPSQSVTEITVKDDSANSNSSLGTVVPSIWPERHTTKTMSKTDKTDETESEKSPSPMSSILPNEYSNKIINTSIPTDQINSKENNIKTTSTSDHNIKEVIKTESSKRGIDKPLNNENNENKDKTNLSHYITKTSESSKSLEDNISLESVFSLSETSLNSITTIKNSVKDDRTGSKESRSPIDSNQPDENSNYTVKKSLTTDQNHMEVNNFNTASETDHPLNKSLEKKNSQKCIDLTVNMDKTDKTDLKKPSQSVTEITVKDDSANGNSSLGTVVPSIWPERHTTKTMSKTDKTDETESEKSPSPMSSILPNEYSNKIINTSIPTDQINSKENNIKTTSTSDHNIKEVIKTESSQRGIDKPLNNENNENKDKTNLSHCITKISESSKSLEDNNSLESVFSLSETSLNSLKTIKNSVYDDRTGSKESRSPIDSNQPDENSNYTVKKSLTTDQNHMEVNNFNTASETDHPLNKSLEKKNSQKCIDLTVNMDKTDKTDLKKPSQSVTDITVKDDSANGNSSLGTVVPSIWPERHTTKTMSKTDKTDETESEKSPSPMSSILPNEYSNKIINTSIPTDQINSKENNIKTTSTSDHNIKEVIKTESSQRGIDKPLNNENNKNKDKTKSSHCMTKTSESSKSLEDNNSLESVFSLSETSLNSIKTIKKSVKDDRTGSKESRSPMDSNQRDENSNYTVKKSITTDQSHIEVNNFNTASDTDHPLNKSLEKKNTQNYIDLTVNMDKTDKTDMKKSSQSVTEKAVTDDSANGNSSLGTVVPSIWPARHTTKTISKTDKTDDTESAKSSSPMSSILPNEYSNKIINTSIPTDQINSKENNIKTTSTSDHNIKEVIKTESSHRGIDKPLNNENNENKDKTKSSHCMTKTSESSKSLEDNNSLESVFSLSETSLNFIKTIKKSVKDDRTGSKESRSPMDSNQRDENSNYTVKKSITTDQNHIEVNNFNTASDTDHPLNKSLEKKNTQNYIDLTVNMDKTDKTDMKKSSQSVTEKAVTDDSANGNSSLGTVVPSIWSARHTTKTMSKTDKTDQTESEKSPSPMSSILPNEYSNKVINTSMATDLINSKENNIKTTSTSNHNIKEVIKTESSHRGIDKPLNNENNENKDKTKSSHWITKTSESSKSLEDSISLVSVFPQSENSLNSIKSIKKSVKDDRTGSKESRSPMNSNQPYENSNYTVKKSISTVQNHEDVNNFNTASDSDHIHNEKINIISLTNERLPVSLDNLSLRHSKSIIINDLSALDDNDFYGLGDCDNAFYDEGIGSSNDDSSELYPSRYNELSTIYTTNTINEDNLPTNNGISSNHFLNANFKDRITESLRSNDIDENHYVKSMSSLSEYGSVSSKSKLPVKSGIGSTRRIKTTLIEEQHFDDDNNFENFSDQVVKYDGENIRSSNNLVSALNPMVYNQIISSGTNSIEDKVKQSSNNLSKMNSSYKIVGKGSDSYSNHLEKKNKLSNHNSINEYVSYPLESKDLDKLNFNKNIIHSASTTEINDRSISTNIPKQNIFHTTEGDLFNLIKTTTNIEDSTNNANYVDDFDLNRFEFNKKSTIESNNIKPIMIPSAYISDTSYHKSSERINSPSLSVPVISNNPDSFRQTKTTVIDENELNNHMLKYDIDKTSNSNSNYIESASTMMDDDFMSMEGSMSGSFLNIENNMHRNGLYMRDNKRKRMAKKGRDVKSNRKLVKTSIHRTRKNRNKNKNGGSISTGRKSTSSEFSTSREYVKLSPDSSLFSKNYAQGSSIQQRQQNAQFNCRKTQNLDNIRDSDVYTNENHVFHSLLKEDENATGQPGLPLHRLSSNKLLPHGPSPHSLSIPQRNPWHGPQQRGLRPYGRQRRRRREQQLYRPPTINPLGFSNEIKSRESNENSSCDICLHRKMNPKPLGIFNEKGNSLESLQNNQIDSSQFIGHSLLHQNSNNGYSMSKIKGVHSPRSPEFMDMQFDHGEHMNVNTKFSQVQRERDNDSSEIKQISYSLNSNSVTTSSERNTINNENGDQNTKYINIHKMSKKINGNDTPEVKVVRTTEMTPDNNNDSNSILHRAYNYFRRN